MAVLVQIGSSYLNPVPFVSVSERAEINGASTYSVTDINLNGFLTGNLASAKEDLYAIFTGDFPTVSITGTDIGITGLRCIIRNFDINPSRAAGVTSYSIGMNCYNPDTLAGQGVINPNNEWNYNEDQNGIVTVTHRIGAEGVNLRTGDALQNARAFVLGLTGLDTLVAGKFGRNTSDTSNLLLMSVSQAVNNASNSYTREEMYRMSTSGASSLPYLRTISVDVVSGIDADFTQVNLSIQQQNTPGLSVTGYLLSSGEMYNLAKSYSNIGAGLNQQPISFEINVTEPKVTYQASYTDDEFITVFDYNLNYEVDNVSQQTSVSIDGVVKSKGHLTQRYANVSGYYAANMSNLETYLYGLSNTFYSTIGGGYTLNPRASRITKKDDPYNAIIEVAATFDDKDYLPGLLDASYSIDTTTPMGLFTPRASCLVTGLYKVFDNEINNRQRTSISVQGSALSGISVINTSIGTVFDNLVSSYVLNNEKVLENEEKTVSTGDINSVTIAKEYSFIGTPLINVQPGISTTL